jgi:hypothetical protein
VRKIGGKNAYIRPADGQVTERAALEISVGGGLRHTSCGIRRTSRSSRKNGPSVQPVAAQKNVCTGPSGRPGTERVAAQIYTGGRVPPGASILAGWSRYRQRCKGVHSRCCPSVGGAGERRQRKGALVVIVPVGPQPADGAVWTEETRGTA